jgi:periplasmic protein TonB
MERNFNTFSAAVRGPLDLKRSYQRNLIKAEIILVVTIGVVLAVVAMVLAKPEPAPKSGPYVVFDTLNFVPPPIVTRIVPQVDNPIPPKPPDVIDVEPVPDSMALPDFVVPSREEIGRFNDARGVPGADSGIFVVPNSAAQEILPEPDSFVAVDEQPRLLLFPSVRYPEMARKAGIEGSVWLKVLIDQDGAVRDVIIVISSGANAGFEEASIAAARDSKWRPAMQNHQPVAVWVAYEVKFKLK